MNIEYITSRSNEYIMKCNSFHDKKNRRRAGVFIFEGIKLFSEAIARGVCFESIIFTEKNKEAVIALAGDINSDARLIEVNDGVYTKLSSEKSPSGIFCVAKAIDKIHKTATIYSSELSGAKIILSSIQDPGNLGTIIRGASAFGFDEIILDEGCADIYNEKTIRAAMGTLFSSKITIVGNCIQAISALRDSGYRVFSAAGCGGIFGAENGPGQSGGADCLRTGTGKLAGMHKAG